MKTLLRILSIPLILLALPLIIFTSINLLCMNDERYKKTKNKFYKLLESIENIRNN